MIHVACAADAAYLPHAAAMLHSVLARHPGATAHLLHGPALPAAELERLREACSRQGGTLRAHAVADAVVADLPAMGRISRVMWYRLFLPELLADADRVLYLDCDVIAMDDLGALWRADLGGAPLGAVSNVFERGMEWRARDLGLSRPSQYFNSGVLLLDLRRWREQRLGPAVLALARSRHLIWPDQDALNLTLAGRWHALHPRWNCQNSLFYFPAARSVFGAAAVADAVRTPGLLHFEGGGPAKPWHYLCKHPFRDAYFRHRTQTPWPTVEIEGRTPANALLRLLPTRWLLAALRVGTRARRALARATAGVPAR